MAIGTIGSFAIIVLANENTARDQAKFNELQAEYQKQNTEYQTKVAAQASELSEEYFDKFNQYADRPAAFDAAGVTELTKTDIVVGTGEEITADSTFTAYYLGWNPTGKVFDGSIDGETLKAPLEVAPGSVIQGWSEGVVGMKVGGVRELAIPSDLAYGETGSGEDIPANTPIKFVVMIIPRQETIEQPTYSQEYIELYTRLYGNG
jgi:FKBP-type peptidyl-prolyl cis-trans isomerase